MSETTNGSEPAKPSGTILILTDDLMFGSRISAEARAAGFTTRSCKTVEKLLEVAPTLNVMGAVVDLGVAGLEQCKPLLDGLRALKPDLPCMGYGSHVDARLLGTARENGYHPVLPRSRFVEELGGIMVEWSNKYC